MTPLLYLFAVFFTAYNYDYYYNYYNYYNRIHYTNTNTDKSKTTFQPMLYPYSVSSIPYHLVILLLRECFSCLFFSFLCIFISVIATTVSLCTVNIAIALIHVLCVHINICLHIKQTFAHACFVLSCFVLSCFVLTR
jgi:hypothetical protein